jgi:Protein of unknown function (DUF1573)
MRVTFLVIAPLLGLLCFHKCWDSLTTEVRPMLVIDDLEKDLGHVSVGERISVEFALSNAGDRRLILQNVESSCECVSGEPSIVVASGKSKALKVKFRAQEATGQMQIETSYSTNDPERPLLTLTVLANVVP